MIKRIAFTLLLIAAAVVSAAAQEKTPSYYAPGREALAEETFQKLIDSSTMLDMMNLAADVSYCGRITEYHPDLMTAVLENIIFDYCKVSDSLMTVENLRVKKLLGIKHYTYRSFPEWDELGRLYAGRRAELENLEGKTPPLHLVNDYLTTDEGLPILRLKKIKALQMASIPPRKIVTRPVVSESGKAGRARSRRRR